LDAEATRRPGKLFLTLGIHQPMLRYDEHTHEPSSRKIIEQLTQGRSIALVTDAGTPAISDPGGRLVHEAVKNGIKITPIPGPSSVAAAVSASGFSDGGYVFLGFLPRRPGRARRMLQEGIGLGRTVVVFESPFRIEQTLSLIHEVAPDADATRRIPPHRTATHLAPAHGQPGVRRHELEVVDRVDDGVNLKFVIFRRHIRKMWMRYGRLVPVIFDHKTNKNQRKYKNQSPSCTFIISHDKTPMNRQRIAFHQTVFGNSEKRHSAAKDLILARRSMCQSADGRSVLKPIERAILIPRRCKNVG